MNDFFNNSQFSDFKIMQQNDANNFISVHKLILTKNLYFKTFFSSEITKNKSQMEVKSLKDAYIIIEYIYKNEINITSENDIFEIYDLSKMWFCYENIKSTIIEFIKVELSSYLKDIKKFTSYVELFTELETDIIKYYEKNKNEFPIELFDYAIFDHFDLKYQLYFIFMHQKYNEFINFSNVVIMNYLRKRNKILSQVCNDKQMSFVKRIKYIYESNDVFFNDNEKNELFDYNLIVKSIIPFKAIIYIYIGIISKIVKNGIIINCVKSLKIGDTIFVINKYKKIRIIKSIRNKKVSKCYPCNTYFIPWLNHNIIQDNSKNNSKLNLLVFKMIQI